MFLPFWLIPAHALQISTSSNVLKCYRLSMLLQALLIKQAAVFSANVFEVFFSYNILKNIFLAVYTKNLAELMLMSVLQWLKSCMRRAWIWAKKAIPFGKREWNESLFSVAVEKTVTPSKVVIGNGIKRYITGKQKRFSLFKWRKYIL